MDVESLENARSLHFVAGKQLPMLTCLKLCKTIFFLAFAICCPRIPLVVTGILNFFYIIFLSRKKQKYNLSTGWTRMTVRGWFYWSPKNDPKIFSIP